MSNLTLGSLFDGSGGFPLGGILAGIKPIWASEIEPFPIRVTTKRLPKVKHYGDITNIHGRAVEPVDIVTFGSPCQDMSIAGRRAGLDGSRSNLFYEAVRVIKEMRDATNGRYPRWAVWENVPGAFSSNKGEDFRCVLEQICKIKDDDFSVPECKKWLPAGKIMGDGFSVAWRVFDAQFWGVPQRRKRIYLVADLAGESAGKILFESEGVSGYSAESFRTWQRAAGGAQDSIGASGIGIDGYNGSITDDVSAALGENCGMSTGRNGIILNDQGGNRMDVTEDVTSTLRAKSNHPPCVMDAAGFSTEHSAKARSIGYQAETAPTLREGVVPAAIALESHPNDSRLKIDDSGSIQTITGRAGTGGGNVPLVMNERQYAMTVSEDVANTLTETDNKGTQCVFENHSRDTRYKGSLEVAQTVSATYGEGGNIQPFVVSGVEPKTLKIRAGREGGGKGALIQSDKSATLGCNNDQTLFVPTAYGICSKHSNAMRSDNPNSGFYEADISRTIDTSNQCPSKNQGGMAVVCVDQGGGKSSVNISEDLSPTLAGTHGGEPAICIQGSVIGRQDKNGPNGSGINEDVAFTLDATDRHAVYAMTSGSYQTYTEEKAPPIMARDYKDAAVVSVPAYGIGRDAFNQGKNALYTPSVDEELQPTIVAKGPGGVALPQSFYPQMKAESMCVTEDVSTTLVNGTNPGYQNGVVEPEYTVRRLTPIECARLQGFPDWWCEELETAEPTAADIAFWTEVFETHRKATGPDKKPKTEKQIIKWLKAPYSDSAEYRLWGNGISLPIVYFVLSGIVWAAEMEGDKTV